MPAPFTANQIADWFLSSIDRTAGDSITHLKLQKLVYYAQAWSLALFNKPLFDEDFQAWVHGPVAYTIYNRFQSAGWEALPPPDMVPDIDKSTQEILNDVLEVYGQHTARYLENLTHHEKPWQNARGNLPADERSTAILSKQSMTAFYAELHHNLSDEEKT